MGLPFIIVVGLVSGWLAAVLRRIESAREIGIQMAVGVIGALVGGLMVSPLLGTESLLAGSYGVPALLLTLAGAAVAVTLLNILLSKGWLQTGSASDPRPPRK